jgi:hypothetical protein
MSETMQPEAGGTRRPAEASDELVEALGKATEALEYVERARGHLYSLHQLIGRADFLLEEAAEQLSDAGHPHDGERLERELVGRNVLDGRWTFQIVEEFDDCYYEPIRDTVRELEQRHVDGARHVYESELKERRRTRGRPGHERRPPRRGAGP